MGSGAFGIVWPTAKVLAQKVNLKGIKMENNKLNLNVNVNEHCLDCQFHERLTIYIC
jgi:hypothetical protein